MGQRLNGVTTSAAKRGREKQGQPGEDRVVCGIHYLDPEQREAGRALRAWANDEDLYPSDNAGREMEACVDPERKAVSRKHLRGLDDETPPSLRDEDRMEWGKRRRAQAADGEPHTYPLGVQREQDTYGSLNPAADDLGSTDPDPIIVPSPPRRQTQASNESRQRDDQPAR